MVIFFFKRKDQNVQDEKCDAEAMLLIFLERERESTFSLGFQLIGPSVFDGARSKVVLRDEGNTWAPVLGSFDKLREVGVLSYLFYS